MSHELFRNIAALDGVGVWHGMANRMQPGMSMEAWAAASGLDFTAVKVPAVAAWDHIGIHGANNSDTGQHFIARQDNRKILSSGTVSDVYQIVQPMDVLNWFGNYILADDRFQLETAGALRHGDTIWASARFNGDATVAGEKVQHRLLMSTTFDCSGATINKPVSTCTVCNNTLSAALAEPQSAIKTRHNTKFRADVVAQELAKVAAGFGKFKAMGDALALAAMSHADVAAFFKALLDIPADAKKDDISTRKMNQYSDLSKAYGQSARERGLDARADQPTAWLALNAVTRYVDHDRSVRNADEFAGGETDARFASAQFGSGAQFKAKAWDMLMPRIKDLVAVAA